jgi:GDPmannose 4,6-dehydratase
VNYREAYDIHASNGILFNHESPRRGETFVTRKITRAAARIQTGLQEKTYLGNLDAERDWGHARDYVTGMWRMLQQDAPGDYVLATGRTTTVRRFCEMAFAAAGIELAWEGSDEDEVGYDAETGTPVVEIDPRYYRPTEVHQLLGEAAKAREELGWTPSTSLEQLAEEMVARDLEAAREEVAVANHRSD